jgi:hypothetical protein
MGWKASLIIIENKEQISEDNQVLEAIGKLDCKFEGETTLDECIGSYDNSISLGRYNGNIIICDSYQLTTLSLEQANNLDLTKEEQEIVKLFPKSEIVSVACHSSMNFHGYSIIDSGTKKRLKTISADTPKVEFGEKIEEENGIYKKSHIKDNDLVWKEEGDDEEYTEDQLMEDFTFGVAKRRLGVLIDHSDGEELLEKVVFKRYVSSKKESRFVESEDSKSMPKWLVYGIMILLIIIWQVLKRTVFK